MTVQMCHPSKTHCAWEMRNDKSIMEVNEK